MIFCTNCGKELTEGARFCANCGTSVSGTQTERKTVYEGEIHKFPNCGDILDAYEAVCQTCGYEKRGTKATLSVRALQAKLTELYSKRPQKKKQSIFGQALTGGQLSSVDEEIISLIKNFPIPNTKEDIMEFLIMAVSNIDLKVYGLYSQQYSAFNPLQREISDAWISKLEQTYKKARLMFGNTQEFLNIEKLYENKENEIKKRKRQLPIFVCSIIGGIFLLFGFMALIIALAGGF